MITKKPNQKSSFTFMMVLFAFSMSLSGCWKHLTTEEKMEHITERIEGRLELTKSQKSELDKLGVSIVSLMKDWQSQKKARLELIIEQMKQPQIDDQKVQKLIQDPINNFNERLPVLVSQFSSFHKSLNPSQRDEIVEKLQDRLDDLD